MKVIQRAIRSIIRRAGFDIIRRSQTPPISVTSKQSSSASDLIGNDPFIDMARFLEQNESPVIFDVGANIGQSVSRFRDTFTTPSIHSFEPSPTTYQELIENCSNLSFVNAWNCAVGSQDTTLKFLENENSDMSSFLAPSKFSWGSITRTTEVPTITIDSFAKKHGIEFIHILKSDTQGYDFEVFKGANQMLSEDRIALIYFEFIFSDMYKDLPDFHEVYRYLSENGFELVSFYESHFQQEVVSWTDVLFINRKFHQKRADSLR